MDSFPLEFDLSVYVTHPNNKDLADFAEARAWEHYEAYGKKEGRICSSIDNREAFLRLVPVDQTILEIGPFFSPAFNKANRAVYYLDCFSTTELKNRALTIEGANSAKIPEIDYVWRGQSYAELTKRRFDNVFSSHNIEHQLCLVRHLNDVSSVLEPNGSYFLAVPDKRYCFDHFLAESTIADVLDAHVSERSSHAIRSVIEHYFLTTHNDQARHWRGDHGADPSATVLRADVGKAIRKEIDRLSSNGVYVDVHAWKFTPESFRVIIDSLFAADFIDLKADRVYSTLYGKNEFYAILKKA